jgi:hypothetical protein
MMRVKRVKKKLKEAEGKLRADYQLVLMYSSNGLL